MRCNTCETHAVDNQTHTTLTTTYLDSVLTRRILRASDTHYTVQCVSAASRGCKIAGMVVKTFLFTGTPATMVSITELNCAHITARSYVWSSSRRKYITLLEKIQHSCMKKMCAPMLKVLPGTYNEAWHTIN